MTIPKDGYVGGVKPKARKATTMPWTEAERAKEPTRRVQELMAEMAMDSAEQTARRAFGPNKPAEAGTFLGTPVHVDARLPTYALGFHMSAADRELDRLEAREGKPLTPEQIEAERETFARLTAELASKRVQELESENRDLRREYRVLADQHAARDDLIHQHRKQIRELQAKLHEERDKVRAWTRWAALGKNRA